MQYQKLFALGAGAAVLSVGAVAFALTPSDYRLLDGASATSTGGGSVQLISNGTTTDSAINYSLATPMTVADLTNLSTDALYVAGSCGGGSPRFQINVQTASGTKNVFAYFGQSPNYSGCTVGTWANTGNLIGASSTVDATQLGGGFYEPWSQVVAQYGTSTVTGIQLVADGGWVFPTTGQIVNVDNTRINGNVYTYDSATSTGTTTPPTGTTTPPTTKHECKEGGWLGLFDGSGHSFKNQGDCVSYVATGGRNEGSGHMIGTTTPTTTPITSFFRDQMEHDSFHVGSSSGHGNGRGNGHGHGE